MSDESGPYTVDGMTRLVLRLICFLAWLLPMVSGAAMADPAELRLLFLRHGDLWSALPDGSGQRLELPTNGTIVSYAAAQSGNQVAVVRRIGALDALEIHDLEARTSLLVRTAEGHIPALAWTGSKQPSLGYAYAPSALSPSRLFLTRGGAGQELYALAADERLLYFYPGSDAVVAIVKGPGGLRWLRCTTAGVREAAGFPGKTITAMPLGTQRWLASLYAPGVGRAIQLLAPAGRELAATHEATTARADLSWSVAPAFINDFGTPLRVVLRADVADPGATRTDLLIWDLATHTMKTVEMPGEVLLGCPLAQPGSKQMIYTCQFQDGSGYGTPPMLYGRDWAGAQRKLLVVDAEQPSWWHRVPAMPNPAPGVVPAAPTEDADGAHVTMGDATETDEPESPGEPESPADPGDPAEPEDEQAL